MSTNLNYKQVANVERRTWDLETYDKRAQDRAKNDEDGETKKSRKHKSPLNTLGPQDDGVDEDQKEEFQRAAKGAAGPIKSDRAFLKARRSRVDVDSKIGSVEIVNPEAVATTKANVGEPGSIKDGVTKTGVGWHCKVCDCFLRDSHTYLDHINGRKHQRNLGFSMRVERSTKDQVSSRLAMLAKEKEKKKNALEQGEESFHDIVKAKDEEERRRKEERARQRKERKKMKKAIAQHSEGDREDEEEHEDPARDENEKEQEDPARDENNVEDETELEEGGIDPALAAMMGFSGFGGGNKSR